MNDNAQIRSVWPVATEKGPALRVLFAGKQEPHLQYLSHEQTVNCVIDLLDALKFGGLPKVS